MRTSLAVVAIALAYTAFAPPYGSAQSSDKTTTLCTKILICYCVTESVRPNIDQHVADLRKQLVEQRNLGKAVGYISVPLSTTGGGYFAVNADTAVSVNARIEARLGKDQVWMLNPGDSKWSLPPEATGADYMYMWTTVLEGADGLGSDFDFFYFVGPADFGAALGLAGKDDMQKLEAYYESHAKQDPALAKIPKSAFRNYYALKASVAFSVGSHDEWNIAKTLNERRRKANQVNGISN